MGLNRRDSNNGAFRLLPEIANFLPETPRPVFTGQDPGWETDELIPPMAKPDELRERVRLTWSDEARGWVGAPSNIVGVLEEDGFSECKHVLATSRRDGRPASGAWQGTNPRTGSTASVVWVAHASAADALVFIEIDGHPIS